MNSPTYRIVRQDENSIQIEYETNCENCGSTVDYSYLMILSHQEKLVLYHDDGCYCANCGLLVEGQSLGIPSREVSRFYQNIEGVWFLTMNLPDQNARNELRSMLNVEC